MPTTEKMQILAAEAASRQYKLVQLCWRSHSRKCLIQPKIKFKIYKFNVRWNTYVCSHNICIFRIPSGNSNVMFPSWNFMHLSVFDNVIGAVVNSPQTVFSNLIFVQRWISIGGCILNRVKSIFSTVLRTVIYNRKLLLKVTMTVTNLDQ